MVLLYFIPAKALLHRSLQGQRRAEVHRRLARQQQRRRRRRRRQRRRPGQARYRPAVTSVTPATEIRTTNKG